MKNLYNENYKTLLKGNEEDTNKRLDIPCLYVVRINTVKMATLPKAAYRFNSIPHWNIKDILQRNRINNPKICVKPQKIPNNQSYIENKEQSWRCYASRFQKILQSLINKNNMVLAQKYITQWNRRKTWELNPSI